MMENPSWDKAAEYVLWQIAMQLEDDPDTLEVSVPHMRDCDCIPLLLPGDEETHEMPWHYRHTSWFGDDLVATYRREPSCWRHVLRMRMIRAADPSCRETWQELAEFATQHAARIAKDQAVEAAVETDFIGEWVDTAEFMIVSERV